MCVFFIDGDNMKEYMEIAYIESLKAYKRKEVPVGAIIVKNGKIIARGYNQKERKNQVTKHAELIAIEKASRKIKNWRLEDCELYTTLEPCPMCLGAIVQSRIKTTYYVIEAENSFIKYHQTKNNQFIKLDLDNKYLELLQKFFQRKRK